MLTGELPFISNDILELVHCHIARHPAPPCECSRNQENGDEIPQVVAEIVMKLLAKNAEDTALPAAMRYADSIES